MRTPSLVSIALAVALLPGCYLFHGVEDEGGVVPPAPAPPRADASVPRPIDAGSPTPLPPEPDPDLGPDGRPSDYPDADDWDDVPTVDELDDCCELDDPILIGSRGTGLALYHEAPAIAWGPSRWGLVVTRTVAPSGGALDLRPLVFELAADGAVLGAARELDRSAEPAPTIRWAEGRWAIAVGGRATTGDERELYARLYDREFRPAGEWLSVGTSPLRQSHLARLTSGDTWLAVRNVGASLAVTAFREGVADAPIEYPAVTGRTLGAVGLRSRVAVLMGGSEEPSRVLVLGAGRSHEVVERVPLATRYVDNGTITALRDLVVVAGIEAGQVRVEVVDPFAGAVVAGPRPITDASGAEMRAIDAIGSSKHGLAGICDGVGAMDDEPRGGAGTIDFRLVGPDGVPRGRPVRVVDSAFRGGMVNCAVGTDDEGFLVAWWDGSSLWVRRVRVPRRM